MSTIGVIYATTDLNFSIIKNISGVKSVEIDNKVIDSIVDIPTCSAFHKTLISQF
jgi:hypothetical protein